MHALMMCGRERDGRNRKGSLILLLIRGILESETPRAVSAVVVLVLYQNIIEMQ